MFERQAAGSGGCQYLGWSKMEESAIQNPKTDVTLGINCHLIASGLLP